MCGIIITKTPAKIDQLKHRGIEVNSIERSGLHIAHHRLPIQTELGDNMTQPIEFSSGDILLYNGEIFNYPKDYDSDIAYLKDFVQNMDSINDLTEEANKWDGFWAIVIITAADHVFAFTDPLGKKQLYYNAEGEICSEIRPLICSGYCFDEYFKSTAYKFGYNRGDETAWGAIKRVTPGVLHQSILGKSWMSVEAKPYYDWDRYQPTKGLWDLLLEATRSRLISKNLPVGVLVSGGLDSSIIACILKQMGADCRYYSVENDESVYANLLAENLGIDLTYLDYNNDTDLEECLRWNESPVDLGSLVPQHKLMSVIPEKIVLTGDGADELFGGYRRAKVYDSQKSDIFDELIYYHLPRLDKASMRYTIEMRNPFLSHDVVKYALSLPREQRIDKKILKDAFRGFVPDEIIDRPKVPLKNRDLVQDPEAYKAQIFDMFYNLKF